VLNVCVLGRSCGASQAGRGRRQMGRACGLCSRCRRSHFTHSRGSEAVAAGAVSRRSRAEASHEAYRDAPLRRRCLSAAPASAPAVHLRDLSPGRASTGHRAASGRWQSHAATAWWSYWACQSRRARRARRRALRGWRVRRCCACGLMSACACWRGTPRAWRGVASEAVGLLPAAPMVPPAPPPPRTKWTRRVPHPVLIGHAASLTPS